MNSFITEKSKFIDSAAARCCFQRVSESLAARSLAGRSAGHMIGGDADVAVLRPHSVLAHNAIAFLHLVKKHCPSMPAPYWQGFPAGFCVVVRLGHIFGVTFSRAYKMVEAVPAYYCGLFGFIAVEAVVLFDLVDQAVFTTLGFWLTATNTQVFDVFIDNAPFVD
jgi:hypothetical protein